MLHTFTIYLHVCTYFLILKTPPFPQDSVVFSRDRPTSLLQGIGPSLPPDTYLTRGLGSAQFRTTSTLIKFCVLLTSQLFQTRTNQILAR